MPKLTKPTTIFTAPTLLNECQAAEYISMSVAYLRADRSRGHLRGVTPGPAFLRLGRTIRYQTVDLDAWLGERRIDRKTQVAAGQSSKRRQAAI